MARPREIDERLVARAKRVAARATHIQQLREAQSILFPALLDMTLEKTAESLGVSRATVHRLQRRFRERRKDGKGEIWDRRGGRRKSLMSWEEEEKFLNLWKDSAQGGGMIVVSPLRAALAQKLGRAVVATVAYRMLARHGWRKVAPDTRHPKSDPAVQEEWKKNFRKSWRICVRKKPSKNEKFV
jgi:transposase